MIIPMALSVLAATLFAAANHIDKYLLSKVKGADYRALCVFSSLAAGGMMVLVYTVVCGFDFSLDGRSIAILFAGAGVCAFLCNLFYFKALERDDATIVTIMLQLTPVFILLLAPFFLPNQEIRPLQLLGSSIIVLAAIAITHEPDKKGFSGKKIITLILMALSSLCYAAWHISIRYVTQTQDFSKTTLWSNIWACSVGVIVFLFAKKYRRAFLKMMRLNGKKVIVLNVCNELISSFAGVITTFADTIASVAIISFMSQGTQPFAVMILGIILTKMFPKIEREKVGRLEIARRFLTIVFCVIGLALIQFG